MQRLVTEGLAAWQVTWRPRECWQHQDQQGQLGVPGQQLFKDCCACILKARGWGIKMEGGFSHVNVYLNAYLLQAGCLHRETDCQQRN